jgi:hypothetical protein
MLHASVDLPADPRSFRLVESASVLYGKREGEDPHGLFRIGRVLGAEFALLVVVDLPKKPATNQIEAAEVVLIMRIVVRVEIREARHLKKCLGRRTVRQ